MELRWAEDAATDLEHIANYLFEHAPRLAEELVREIYGAANGLPTFPYRGRPGKKDGTREVVLSRLPYIVIYQITGDVIHVVRILHGAQKWP
jgi:toxin ParE1/3/4